MVSEEMQHLATFIKYFFSLSAIIKVGCTMTAGGEIFQPTENCLRPAETIGNASVKYFLHCALKCLTEPSCVSIGFSVSTGACRYGSAVMDHTIDSADCTARESIYQLSTATVITCNQADGWYYNAVSGYCVKIFHSNVLKPQASANCETIGAKLAAWKSLDSLNVFKDLIEDTDTGWLGDGTGVWTDATLGNDGVWRWSDGTDVDSDLWNPPNPNGNGPCTSLYKSVQRLDDLPCDIPREYACERSP